jgi:type II secretory ATPase GspE/PulE/Tfp pilus assembly ATPase PilB-like protein
MNQINPEEIPQVEGLEELTLRERIEIMIVREGRSDEAPIEQQLRNIFLWAIINRASDVHVSGRGNESEPTVYVTIRTPKRLVNTVYNGAKSLHFKTKLFQLTATPQGGSTPDMLSTRFGLRLPAAFARRHGLVPFGDRPYLVDVRVQYVRTYDGFAFTCRLLDQQRAPKLHELGLSYALETSIRRTVQEPSGLVLVSGPTGSGKTTLLNAILGTLNDGQHSVLTIENPVEFNLEGIGPIKQVQVGGDITFARALRAGLRLDPDVILIGEIRDQETMEIALQAAQTGHLVMATIHANSGSETFSRALDLTLDKRRDAFRLADTLKFVMAQRLLDRYEGVPGLRHVTREEAEWLAASGLSMFTSVNEVAGGEKIGKVALIEAIAVTPSVKLAIRAERLDVSEVYRAAASQVQYETLAAAGLRAVQSSGCRLADCMTRLESNSDAAAHPGLRLQLAQEHGLSLVEVAAVLDKRCRLEANGDRADLGDLIAEVKEAARCALNVY